MDDLNLDNCVSFICKFIERAQQCGTFSIEEAHVLNISINACTQKDYSQISLQNALENMIKAVHQGQKHGNCFTLSDASNLYQILVFIQNNYKQLIDKLQSQSLDLIDTYQQKDQQKQDQQKQDQQKQDQQIDQKQKDQQNKQDTDLSDLADPIPLTFIQI